jgi:2-polyprenyl-3-methyl-5-hydroxy-6-metoxy-1,4-benzoquinol methylase
MDVVHLSQKAMPLTLLKMFSELRNTGFSTLQIFSAIYKNMIFKRNKPVPQQNMDMDGSKYKSSFDTPYYQQVTNSEIEHFDTMGIDVKNKKIIDLGCGVGRLTPIFTKETNDLICVDGRQANLDILHADYPAIKTGLIDVEVDDLKKLGTFDIVFCYGLLYHVSEPYNLIKKISEICHDTLLLSTCILDSSQPNVYLIEEHEDNTQAMHLACRPSPEYIKLALKHNGFKFIYETVKVPQHPQYMQALTNSNSYMNNGILFRRIFVASKREISSPGLKRIN